MADGSSIHKTRLNKWHLIPGKSKTSLLFNHVSRLALVPKHPRGARGSSHAFDCTMTLTTHLHFQSPLYLHGIGTASTLHLPLQQLHFMLLTSLTTFWMGETKENKKKIQ